MLSWISGSAQSNSLAALNSSRTAVQSVRDGAAAASDSPAAARGGGTCTIGAAAAAGVLVHEDLLAPALLAAERPVASVHVDVPALGELPVAQAAALQEGARRRRRRDVLLLGAVDQEGGLADDLRRRLLPRVVLVGGLQYYTQPGHGARTQRVCGLP